MRTYALLLLQCVTHPVPVPAPLLRAERHPPSSPASATSPSGPARSRGLRRGRSPPRTAASASRCCCGPAPSAGSGRPAHSSTMHGAWCMVAACRARQTTCCSPAHSPLTPILQTICTITRCNHVTAQAAIPVCSTPKPVCCHPMPLTLTAAASGVLPSCCMLSTRRACQLKALLYVLVLQVQQFLHRHQGILWHAPWTPHQVVASPSGSSSCRRVEGTCAQERTCEAVAW